MSQSAMPATQSEGRCREVPRLPRKRRGGDHSVQRGPSAPPVPAQRCHACHAKCQTCHANGGGDHGAKSGPSAQPEPALISATPATQSDDPCREVPRLPRKVTIDVAKCHACHAK